MTAADALLIACLRDIRVMIKGGCRPGEVVAAIDEALLAVHVVAQDDRCVTDEAGDPALQSALASLGQQHEPSPDWQVRVFEQIDREKG